MDNFYLYQYYNKEDSNVLVVFCAGENIDVIFLKGLLRKFFAFHVPPDEIFIIGGSYLKEQLDNLFNKNNDFSSILEVIPLSKLKKDHNSIKVLVFDENGNYSSDVEFDPKLLRKVLLYGIQNIFKERGGLIEAPSSIFHYEFPSGKHATRFLRTGNILINSSEIFFIAAFTLKFINTNFSTIYCDTSSINSIGFAIVELKKLFDRNYITPSIKSFGSYEKFENYQFGDTANSLILISASTSGNLVTRLKEKNDSLNVDNLLILFYLSDQKKYEERILCDLTFDEIKNPNGYKLEDSHNETDCEYCRNGSYKVKISGDVFLLEKPKIKPISIRSSSAPKWLSSFMEAYRSRNGFNFIRCYYGEESGCPYEIYFDLIALESHVEKEPTAVDYLKRYITKFENLVNQYVPANLKYIVYLSDQASKIISTKIKKIIDNDSIIEININDLGKKSKEVMDIKDKGAILIVSSCVVSGNNLLYINKFLRQYEDMTKTYFVSFLRSTDKGKTDFLKKSIGQGMYGINTNPLLVLEEVSMSDLSEHNLYKLDKLSWSFELDIFKEIKDIIEEDDKLNDAKNYIDNRITELEEAGDIDNQGLINNVFLKNPSTNTLLQINKSFVFFQFDDYKKEEVSQADIYFTISTVLNNLRYSNDNDVKIVQEEYIRSIIDPENFNRYDDGVIQAAILRATYNSELNYSIDQDASRKMISIICKMIEKHNDDNIGEGLIEFIYAIAIKKLKLTSLDLKFVISKLDLIDNSVFKAFSSYIKKNILKEKKELRVVKP